VEYTFFSVVLETFSKTQHILDHNATLNNYKKFLYYTIMKQNQISIAKEATKIKKAYED
jgi:hypothetical protein